MTRGSCNSHCVSQFAAFFLDVGTEISTVENFRFCLFVLCFQTGRNQSRWIMAIMILLQVLLQNSFWKWSKPTGSCWSLKNAISGIRILPTAPVSRWARLNLKPQRDPIPYSQWTFSFSELGCGLSIYLSDYDHPTGISQSVISVEITVPWALGVPRILGKFRLQKWRRLLSKLFIVYRRDNYPFRQQRLL